MRAPGSPARGAAVCLRPRGPQASRYHLRSGRPEPGLAGPPTGWVSQHSSSPGKCPHHKKTNTDQLGGEAGDPALVSGVSGGARGGGRSGVPRRAVCRARPQVRRWAHVHAACLQAGTSPAPAVGSAWRPGPGPWLQELVGGSWREGRWVVSPWIAGWLPAGAHAVAVDAPSPGGRSSSRPGSLERLRD